MMVNLLPNYSLERLNTFGIAVKAKHYVCIQSVEQLHALFHISINERTLILGGGSNVLFVKDFPGCVVHIKIGGIEVVREEDNAVWVKAGGGILWDTLVGYALEKGYGGIENLSLIPGTVGAAPIQNIGAYGVDLKDVFVSLEAMEIATGNIKIFTKEACGFGCRHSIFKGPFKRNFIILNVTIKLAKHPQSFYISYGTIKATLQDMRVTTLSIQALVRQSFVFGKISCPTLNNWAMLEVLLKIL